MRSITVLAGIPICCIAILLLFPLSVTNNQEIAMERLHVCKNPLHLEQEVFEATFDEGKRVDQAAKWADALVCKVHRGPGDSVEAAMYRAETKFGVPYSTLWALRYRKPKGMFGGAWEYLKHVYEAECGRQEARLRHELELVKALPRNEARQALIDETEAALGIAPSLKTGTDD